MYSRAARLVREQKVGKGWQCSRWERAGRRRRGGVRALGARERKKNRRKREGKRGWNGERIQLRLSRREEKRSSERGRSVKWTSEKRGRGRMKEKDGKGRAGSVHASQFHFTAEQRQKRREGIEGTLRRMEMTKAYYNCPFVSRYTYVRWKHEKHLLLETCGADNSAAIRIIQE